MTRPNDIEVRLRDIENSYTYRCPSPDEVDWLTSTIREQQARIEELEKALEMIASWRTSAHEYDDDVGYPRRDFDEETVTEMEGFAKSALAKERK